MVQDLYEITKFGRAHNWCLWVIPAAICGIPMNIRTYGILWEASCSSQVMQEEGGGSFWATFGGGTNGAEVASCAPRNFDCLTPSKVLIQFKNGDLTTKNVGPTKNRDPTNRNLMTYLQNWWCNGDPQMIPNGLKILFAKSCILPRLIHQGNG